MYFVYFFMIYGIIMFIKNIITYFLDFNLDYNVFINPNSDNIEAFIRILKLKGFKHINLYGLKDTDRLKVAIDKAFPQDKDIKIVSK